MTATRARAATTTHETAAIQLGRRRFLRQPVASAVRAADADGDRWTSTVIGQAYGSSWATGIRRRRAPGGPAPPRRRPGRARRSGGNVQSNSPRMSSALMAPDSKPPASMTLANRADFFAFSAITFSSMVPLATSR